MDQQEQLLRLSLLPEDKLSSWEKSKYTAKWFFTDKRYEPEIGRFKVGGFVEYKRNAIFFINAQSTVGNFIERPFACKGRVPARFLYVKASRWEWGIPVAYQLIFEELNPEKNDFGLINCPYLIYLNFSLSYTPDNLQYAGFDMPKEADVWLTGMVELEKCRERIRKAIEGL